MPIILDPNKQLINITCYYIEQIKPHGNSVFHFIKSAEELLKFQNRGFVLEKDAQRAESGKEATSPDKIIYTLETTWRTPTWRDQNTIFSKSIKHLPKPDGTSYSELDAIAYRDWKLKLCLKKWNILGPDQKPMEVTEGLIDNLNPMVAQELLAAFETVSEPSDDQLKN